MNKFSTSVGIIFFFLFSFFNVNSQTKNNPFSELDKTKISTGLLYNKVKIPVSQIKDCNGISKIQIINSTKWRDIYSELYFSSFTKELSNYQSIKNEVKSKIRQNVFPIGIINYSYNEFKENAVKSGLISIKNNKYFAEEEDIYNINNVFATSVIDSKQYTGLNPIFDFSEKYYYSNSENKLIFFEIDFNDGKSSRKVYLNDKIKIDYKTEGEKTINVKANFENGITYYSKFKIKISSPKMPDPSETWTDYTADEAYLGEYAHGEVGVFFGNGNSEFTKPVIIVDGFDPGDTRDIAGLWDIANQQNMADSLIAEGYDFIIVNFYGGDDYIQRNALLVKKVIQEINARMTSAGTMKDANQIAVIGPSMGGLITRYAIRDMEQNSINHNVRNWISFDSPMKGADIPLGLQHWVRYFGEEVEVASALEALASLSGPAAKQMLIYHYTATTGNTANNNGLYTSFYNELNAMDFPENTRIVSIINGDGYGNGQGFFGGDKIIDYEYYGSWPDPDIIGNCWAVPDQSNHIVFEGYVDKPWPLPNIDREEIYVNNTLPYDGAPGGSRNTLKELAETDPGYGSITAPWDAHAFIPTISSLCIQNTTDPYYNVDANINSIITPFDKIYYPSGNQEHVAITPESYNWFYHEVINFAPQFTSDPITIATEDIEYTYTLSATDENEWNVLSYELIEKPDWLNFNSVTGEFTGTPLNENVGEHNVSVKVKDELDETTQTFTITVENTNDVPVITSTAIETATEDVEYSYTFTATDEDPIPDVLTFSTVEIPAWLNFDDATGILSGTPLNEDVGVHNITLRVNDGTVDVDQVFTITVENTNDAPVITSVAIETATEDIEYSYTFTATDEDPVPDVLTFSTVEIPAWLNFDDATGILSGTPLNENVGVHNVTLRVNDGTVDVDQVFTITVENTNDVPVITSTAIETATEDVEYSYTFTATDEDPGPDVLTFSTVEIPTWLNFDDATRILSGTPLNEDVGVHNVTLRVNDGTVDVDQTFTITVENTNDAPILQNELEDQETYTNELFNYTFTENSFFDVDAGDILSYTANLTNNNPLPAWLSFDSDTRTFSGTPSVVQNYEISVTATDLGGASISDEFILNVNGHISVNKISDNIRIYPNPASNILYIENTESINKIEIINIQGQEISTIQNINKEIIEINISDMSKGIYFLKISSQSSNLLKKLIIE